MDTDYPIVAVAQPEESAWGIIGRGLGRYNEQQAGPTHFQRICFAVYNPEQEIVAGVVAEYYWSWLHIDLLWVKEDLRGAGYGRRLLARVEEEGCSLGAKNAFLDTFSFQAPEFYKKYGYQVFAELPDYPPGHLRYFMFKAL